MPIESEFEFWPLGRRNDCYTHFQVGDIWSSVLTSCPTCSQSRRRDFLLSSQGVKSGSHEPSLGFVPAKELHHQGTSGLPAENW